MKLKLDKWQEEVDEATGDILLCTGRRVGKTFILAKKGVDRMVKHPKTPIIVMSLTEDQAMIINTMALNYLKEEYPKEGYSATMKKILLDNGSEMICRPAGDTGEGVRGFEGGVLIVDEASRMKKLFWLAARPILLTTNGDLWMGSTPFGKQGYFWDRFNDSYILKKPDARFKTFYISTEEVIKNRPISESWTQKQKDGAIRILAEDKKEMSEMEYGQEYLGLFLDELRQFFPDELIKKVMVLDRELVSSPLSSLYLGVDIARMGRDESTFEILRQTGKQLTHIRNIITKKKLLTETAQKILDLDSIYNFGRKAIGIDDAGLGAGVFDILMKSDQIKRKVIGLNNATRPIDRDGKTTKLLKELMYTNFLAIMERGEIQLLKDDEIRVSLESVQYEYKNGKLYIFGEKTHIVEGLVRAAHCAKNKTLNIYVY